MALVVKDLKCVGHEPKTLDTPECLIYDCTIELQLRVEASVKPEGTKDVLKFSEQFGSAVQTRQAIADGAQGMLIAGLKSFQFADEGLKKGVICLKIRRMPKPDHSSSATYKQPKDKWPGYYQYVSTTKLQLKVEFPKKEAMQTTQKIGEILRSEIQGGAVGAKLGKNQLEMWVKIANDPRTILHFAKLDNGNYIVNRDSIDYYGWTLQKQGEAQAKQVLHKKRTPSAPTSRSISTSSATSSRSIVSGTPTLSICLRVNALSPYNVTPPKSVDVMYACDIDTNDKPTQPSRSILTYPVFKCKIEMPIWVSAFSTVQIPGERLLLSFERKFSYCGPLTQAISNGVQGIVYKALHTFPFECKTARQETSVLQAWRPSGSINDTIITLEDSVELHSCHRYKSITYLYLAVKSRCQGMEERVMIQEPLQKAIQKVLKSAPITRSELKNISVKMLNDRKTIFDFASDHVVDETAYIKWALQKC